MNVPMKIRVRWEWANEYINGHLIAIVPSGETYAPTAIVIRENGKFTYMRIDELTHWGEDND